MKLIIKNIFFFIASFVAILMALDIFIYFASIETKSSTDFTEEYGRCRRKNMDYVYFNEGFSMGHLNEGRYLNSYYPIQKPNNVIRIAAIGDSYVEGFQVFERNHFLKLTENKLNETTKDSVQILNFGRSGFDLGDMYAYYERIVKQYNCDYVLFFVSNADLDIKQTDVLIPKTILDTSGELIVTNNLMPKAYKETFIKQLALAHYSTVYKMLNDSRKLIKSGMLFPKLFDKFYPKEIDTGEEDIVAKSNINVSDLSFLILQKLKNEKAKIIFVNRDKTKIAKSFIEKINYPLSYFDLTKESNLYNQNFDPHYWKVSKKRGHWNMEANRIISKKLYELMQQSIKLPTY